MYVYSEQVLEIYILHYTTDAVSKHSRETFLHITGGSVHIG